MNTGDFRYLLTLLQPVRTPDTLGQSIPAYVAAGRAWFSCRPLFSREAQSAKQLYVLASHKLQGRYIDCSAMDASWRLRDEDTGVVYKIDSCDHYPQADETNITAEVRN